MRIAQTFMVLLLLPCASVAALGQVSQPDTTARKEQRFRTAKNRWMLVPVDIRAQRDDAAPAERQARDTFWDSLIGASTPLSQPQASHLSISEGSNLTTAPEFPILPNAVWLLGRFDGYHSFLSLSQRSIYTEINIRVEHVFLKPNDAPLAKGTVIDVGRPGGTILAPWGGVVSYLVDEPRAYDDQPNHTYLLLLQYHAEGSFYVEARRWELTDGIVSPDSQLEKHRSEKGNSEINGLTVAELIKYLDKKFAK